MFLAGSLATHRGRSGRQSHDKSTRGASIGDSGSAAAPHETLLEKLAVGLDGPRATSFMLRQTAWAFNNEVQVAPAVCGTVLPLYLVLDPHHPPLLGLHRGDANSEDGVDLRSLACGGVRAEERSQLPLTGLLLGHMLLTEQGGGTLLTGGAVAFAITVKLEAAGTRRLAADCRRADTQPANDEEAEARRDGVACPCACCGAAMLRLTAREDALCDPVRLPLAPRAAGCCSALIPTVRENVSV